MAWTDGNSVTRKIFGTCGNFKFCIYNMTDMKATRNIIKPMLNKVYFVSTTNVTDNTDVLAGKTLSWTGSADSDDENQLTDSGETFDKMLTGQIVYNTEAGDAKLGQNAIFVYEDSNTGNLFSTATKAATDLCVDGDEDYIIDSQRLIQVVAGTANDDGTMFVFGG